MLLGKIKLYDIAKELNLTSKEVLEIAKKLNIDAKSNHAIFRVRISISSFPSDNSVYHKRMEKSRDAQEDVPQKSESRLRFVHFDEKTMIIPSFFEQKKENAQKSRGK